MDIAADLRPCLESETRVPPSRELAAFGPVKLEDNRVAIHPIEWTQ